MSHLVQFQDDSKPFQLMQNSWAAVLNPVIQKNDAIGFFKTAKKDSAVTLTTTNTIYNLTNIEIPPGIWLIWSFVSFPSLPSNTAELVSMISLSPTTQSSSEYDGGATHWNGTPGTSVTQPCGPFPLRAISPTKYYLNAKATFTGSSPTVVGTIYAMQFGVL